MKLNIFAATTALVVLAACGGSSTGNFGDFAADLESDFDTALDGVNLSQTANADLKTSGSADYTGLFAVSETGDADEVNYLAIGEGNVNVNFGTGNATGSASNFYEVDLDNSNLDSESFDDISATAIDGEFNVTDGGQSLTGTLTQLSGDEVAYELDVDNSTYFGANQENLEVEGSGTASNGSDAGFFFDGIDASLLD